MGAFVTPRVCPGLHMHAHGAVPAGVRPGAAAGAAQSAGTAGAVAQEAAADGGSLMRALATMLLFFNGGREDSDSDEESEEQELEEGEEGSPPAERATRKRRAMPSLFEEVPLAWRRCLNMLNDGRVFVGTRAVAGLLPAMRFDRIGEEDEVWVSREAA